MSRIDDGNGGVGGHRVEAGDGAGEVALGGEHGRGAHAGKHRIGAVAFRLEGLQRAERLVVLAFVGEFQRLREVVARAVGAALDPVIVADEAAVTSTTRTAERQRRRAVAVPQRLRLVLAHFLVDFADEAVV